jgi:protein-S-isoprenylcysteine O-methyltransferase Ste14
MLKLIFEFYLILFVPLVYLLGIFIISRSLFIIHYPLSVIFGLMLIFIGLILWIWSYLTLRSSLTVLPKAKKLITSGPYQHLSHPMYLAIILTFLGFSLASGSIPGLLYTVSIIIPLNVLRAKKEEEKLFKKFGKKYEEYKKRLPL